MKKSRHINNWSDKKENILKFWREECQIYNYLYNQNVEYYQSLDKWLGIIAIMLSAITGTTLVNQGNNSSPESASRNHIILLIFGMISMVNTFIQSLRQFLDIPNKLNSNHNAAKQNSCIAMDIDEQLILSKSDRIDGKEFMKNIKLRKNELVKNGPLILKRQWHKFRKKIENGEPVSFLSKSFMNNYLKHTVNISGAMDIKLLESASNHSSDNHSISSLDANNNANNSNITNNDSNINNTIKSTNKRKTYKLNSKVNIPSRKLYNDNVPSYRDASYGNSSNNKLKLKHNTVSPMIRLVNDNAITRKYSGIYSARNNSNSSVDSNGSNLNEVYTDINILESRTNNSISSNISNIELSNNYSDTDYNLNLQRKEPIQLSRYNTPSRYNTSSRYNTHSRYNDVINNNDDIHIEMENIEDINSVNNNSKYSKQNNENNAIDLTYSIVNNYATTSNENTDTESETANTSNHAHSDDDYTNSEEEFLKSMNDDNKCQRQLSQFISTTKPNKKLPKTPKTKTYHNTYL